MKKKIFLSFMCLLSVTLLLSGCGKKNENLDMDLDKVIDKVYEGISSDEMPMVNTTEVTKDNVTYYLGTDKIDYKEAYASEPLMSSIAYSVVVVRLNDGADVNEAKQLIKDNVDPRKWFCVDAEIVTVDNIGDTIMLIMMDELNEDLATKIRDNFLNLK